MNQNNNVITFLEKKYQYHNALSNRDKVIFAYHSMLNDNSENFYKLLSEIPSSYYTEQFHKDISRALLCFLTYKTSQNHDHGKESEFYIIVYRLVKHIVDNKLNFKNSGYFKTLKDELFKDLM